MTAARRPDGARFPEVEGFILAGGASSRMGRDKALLEIAGAPLIVRTADLLGGLLVRVTVIAPTDRYTGLGLTMTSDLYPGVGTLGGVATALRRASAPWSLIMACDLPFVTKSWLEHFIPRALDSGADAVFPRRAMCALWSKRCEEPTARAIEAGTQKVKDALGELRVLELQEPEWRPFDAHGCLFMNVNTPKDFAVAKRILERTQPR